MARGPLVIPQCSGKGLPLARLRCRLRRTLFPFPSSSPSPFLFSEAFVSAKLDPIGLDSAIDCVGVDDSLASSSWCSSGSVTRSVRDEELILTSRSKWVSSEGGNGAGGRGDNGNSISGAPSFAGAVGGSADSEDGS